MPRPATKARNPRDAAVLTPPAHRPVAPSAPPATEGSARLPAPHLPRLYAGRALRLAVEDPAYRNFCRYDCAYCVSRRSSNVERARFTVAEVVQLTLDLYRRNCIEGLFLSSGIARNEDDTMEGPGAVAKALAPSTAFAVTSI